MVKKSDSPFVFGDVVRTFFVFGDVVRTLDGCGPVMMVKDPGPSYVPPLYVLCEFWAGKELRTVAVHSGLLEPCDPIPAPAPPKSFLERLAPLVTMAIEAVDLWAAVESGRSVVVAVPGSDEPDEPGQSSRGDTEPPSCVDESLTHERVLWSEAFQGLVPSKVFADVDPDKREAMLATTLSLVRGSGPEERDSCVSDLMVLVDFALRCGYTLDRRRAVEALHRILDARQERVGAEIAVEPSGDVTSHQRESLGKGDSYCGRTCGPFRREP
jgi:hypothetical protein